MKRSLNSVKPPATALFCLFMVIAMESNTSSAQLQGGSFPFEGVTRHYFVFLPQGFQPDLPVVLNLHGLSSDATWQMDYSLMHLLADTAGFIVAYPDAVAPGFNSGLVRKDLVSPPSHVNDVGFLSALIDTLDARYNIDMSRVYSCGFSNGGMMTFRLAGQIGHRFAAGAAVAGTVLDSISARFHTTGSFPLLICNGTEDVSVPFGGGRPDFWSVQQTLDYWIQNNSCLVPGTTVALPDVDSSDSCTVEKTTYRTGTGNPGVILYKVIDGGHSWPGSAFPFSGEGHKNGDININAEMWDFFRQLQNPLVDVAFGEDLEELRKHVSPRGDTLRVTGRIRNPAGHPVTVFALLKGLGTSHLDSVEMFDDGAHGDVGLRDNVWGGIRNATGLEEDVYEASLLTYDGSLSTRHRFYQTRTFTTAGPMRIDGYAVVSSDTAAAPGKILSYRLSLRNLGATATVDSVTATVRCLNPDVIAQSALFSFGDVGPGQSSTCSNALRVLYTPSCPGDQHVEFAVEISSNATLFWEDTFSDFVTEVGDAGEGVPQVYALEQNYPNPFNPGTTIEYALPHAGYFTLKVFNVLGEEVAILVAGDHAAGFYETTWKTDGLASGVYLYRLNAGNFVQTRKMLLLR